MKVHIYEKKKVARSLNLIAIKTAHFNYANFIFGCWQRRNVVLIVSQCFFFDYANTADKKVMILLFKYLLL